ncbi:transglutaminase family protein [uncultured Microbacterium sp.]|uniref:transglutaminase-like domain-containing protein n=1 Tax=uncultured Microbacterium sp. TaxID=191216 RepID=UPI0025DE17F7|nr:transglutaminase family protein [uncultured Microbacterium sp.]
MPRRVTAELDLDLGASVDLIFQIAAARGVPVVDENLTFAQGERRYTATELVDQAGSRLHRLTAEEGPLSVRYDALVAGPAQSPRTSDLDTIGYLRPSRYCQSDEVFAQARRQFRGLAGRDLLAAVSGFVASTVTYTPGLSFGTDSAVTTLATGQGVCRDYAHLVIALLRAMDMPARYAACFAPGLEPMDFHAVVEAFVEGRWEVVDATRLAPRAHFVRIATGRDAADTAFLTTLSGIAALASVEVTAVALGDLVVDDPEDTVLLR